MSNMLVKPNRSASEVLSLVQARLAPYQPAGTLLEVLPNAVHHEGRWWYVVVPPSTSVVNASDYNRRMEKAERDLKKMDDLYVSILPVVPDWMDAQK